MTMWSGPLRCLWPDRQVQASSAALGGGRNMGRHKWCGTRLWHIRVCDWSQSTAPTALLSHLMQKAWQKGCALWSITHVHVDPPNTWAMDISTDRYYISSPVLICYNNRILVLFMCLSCWSIYFGIYNVYGNEKAHKIDSKSLEQI